MVGLLEKMSANVGSGASSLLNFAALIPPPSPPLSIPYRPLLPTQRLQYCSTDVHKYEHQPPFAGCAARNSGCSALWISSGKMRKFPVRSCNVAMRPQVSQEGTSDVGSSGRTAIVWFKRDLRLDDHPGLVAASTYENVLPLYVFDPELIAGWSAELVESLRDAVLDLRKSLQNINSDLVIKFGRTVDVLRDIAGKVNPLDIITEEEVEMEWHHLVRSVSATLSDEEVASKDMVVKQWRSSIYEIEGLQEVPDCYKKFQKLNCPLAAPLDPPTSLPCLPTLPRSFDRGPLPSVEEISSAIATTKSNNQDWEDLKAAQEAPAEVLLGAKVPVGSESPAVIQNPSGGARKGQFAWWNKYIMASPLQVSEKRREIAPVPKEGEDKGYVLKGGATGALNILRGYLRFLEPTGRDDWQEVNTYIGSLEQPSCSSFRVLFGNALALGTLSLRRIYQEAMEYEKARGGGWLSPFGFSTFTGAAAIRDSKAIEWYQLLALKSREQGREQGLQVGTWRWRGFLIQYALAGDTGPPVVFVHGFGAFWQHWRDNIKSVAECGHRVFALTMLGFGRSEKPLITYTDLVWGELVRDFIVEVVREPVVVAGNSIGGYTVSVVAGLWPSLVKSVVLLNSAGRVVPEYKSLKYNKPREKSSVAYVGSRLLLAYLQNLSNGMLTKCYPTNPWRADTWLQDEVMRASYDPNATAVLEAMFHLRAPLPLNYYLDRYNGDILVIQGMRDPLHNSSKRASMLQAYCKNVSIQYVNAGHCPQDEVPEDVNSILTSWLKERRYLQSKAAVENGFPNGALKTNPVTADTAELSSEGTNGVVPDVLIRIKEEVEELV